MVLSMKWLRDYVDVDVDKDPHEFCEDMTMSGSKVENYSICGSDIKNVVVGKILSVVKHPNADKLVICRVDIGDGTVQIVTGAKNVFPGALVPVALDGAKLPGGVKINRTDFRGETSDGMMCSLKELGLSVNDFPYAVENGIFIIQEECEAGQDIVTAAGLDDTVVEFEITPNRPDCLSVLGLAREAAATFDKQLHMPEHHVKGGSGKTADYVTAEVQEPSLCTRYTARAVRNVKIGPSPRWMRERLRASGVRPINNIVDITNFVMLEYGQPMHAFDYRLIAGGGIRVRLAKPGEKITTLDGVERILDGNTLVIADSDRPVAVAGVMGGENSGIVEGTDTVIFESAVFDSTSVRETSKKLGLRTEASSRFEKGLDPDNTIPALNRACAFVELLGAGEVCGDLIDINHAVPAERKIKLDPDWVNRFLGTSIPAKFMADALIKLHFKVDGDLVTVPSYRRDVEQKADIAEEIARIYGYNKIPTVHLGGAAIIGGLNDRQKFVRGVHSSLVASGFYEISTYSFISPKFYDRINVPKDSGLRHSLKIINPLGEDTSVMRTTTLPSMLETLARNYRNRNESAALYDLGSVYIPGAEGELPDEKQKITLGIYGGDADFFTLKGAVEALLDRLGVKGYGFAAEEDLPAFHPGRCAAVLAGGEKIGVLGEIHPDVLSEYGIETRAYAAVLDLEAVYKNRQKEIRYAPLPKFPAITRDIAMICGEELPVGKLEETIRSAAPDVVESIKLFDVYRGKQISEGRKSVAFSISMRAADRTLTDGEADEAVQEILSALSKLGAERRS